MSAEQQIKTLGLELPPVPPPAGNYVPCVQTGNLLFLSGKGPIGLPVGKVGADTSVEEAYEHARSIGLTLLSAIRNELGTLDRVERVVKVLGMVNAAPEFGKHPAVINGCSDLFVEVFGESGRHARSAVGMGSLPNAMTVEIECIVEVRPE